MTVFMKQTKAYYSVIARLCQRKQKGLEIFVYKFYKAFEHNKKRNKQGEEIKGDSGFADFKPYVHFSGTGNASASCL